MKQTLVWITAALALSLTGCGKSDSELKIETSLNDEIARLHDSGMQLVGSLSDLESQLDTTLTVHDSLAKAYPDLFTVAAIDELKTAREKVGAARLAMATWMREHKRYDRTMPHRQAVDLLTRERDALLGITDEMNRASAAANSALGHARQLREKMKRAKQGTHTR